MIGLITLQRNNLLLRVIDVSITVTQVSTQCPYPIYQLCVFPPNLPVVCVLPPNLPVVCVLPPNLPVVCVLPPNLPVVCVSTQFTSWMCVSTQFTSCVCFHPIYQLCVFPPNLPVVCVFQPNLPVVCVFPPYLPVVSASTLSLYTGCVCVCVFPPYIPAVRVPIFCFYQILTAFDKLKIMSEVPHNKWQLKRCCNYSHKMFQSRDSKLWAVTADSINTFINLNMKLIVSLMLTSRVTM